MKGRGLTIPSFEGLATNPARGLQLLPSELVNVSFERPGGYSPMLRASQQASGVSRAIPALNGRRLFVQRASDVAYFDPATFSLTGIGGTTGDTLTAGSLPIMPDLALAADGASWLTPTGLEGFGSKVPTIALDDSKFPPGQPPWGSGEGTAAAGAVAVARGHLPASPSSLPNGDYQLLFVFIPTPTAPYGGTATFTVTATNSPQVRDQLALYFGGSRAAGTLPICNVYVRQVSGTPTGWVFATSNVAADQSLLPCVFVTALGATTGGALAHGDEVTYGDDNAGFTVDASASAAYHQGRVWLAAASYQKRQYRGLLSVATNPQALPGNRVLYSEVIASASGGARPLIYLDNNIDLNFRASNRVVGFLSAGRYLYILGDREVFVLTGYDDASFQIEALGESIGCLSVASIQTLGNVGYYLGDSGVLAISGGSTQDVSAPVRDLVQGLNLATLSSTVDYNRETYILSDGVTTLCYSTREQKWSTRQIDGESQRYLFGGGTAYSTYGVNLYAVSGEPDSSGKTPALLPMTVGWPPCELGDWATRKAWRGLFAGIDADGPGAVEDLSRVQDFTGEGDRAPTPQRQVFEPGVRPVAFSWPSTLAVGVAPRLRVVPDDLTTRCVLRPPLQVPSGSATESPVN